MASMNMPERHITLQNGTKVLIRPLTIEEAKLYPDFVHEVSSEDLRLRFFCGLAWDIPALVDKFVHFDPARAMAFIAIEESNGKMLGVVRVHDDSSGVNGEFAILLRSRLKGYGLGWLMMKHMIPMEKAAASRR
jgi:hypothetical protein